MNERARRLLDEKFGAWQTASAREAYWGRWGKSGSPNAYALIGFNGWIVGARVEVEGGRVMPYPTADEARAALDAALLRSVIAPVLETKYGPWRVTKTLALARGDARVFVSGDCWGWWCGVPRGKEPTEDAAKLAADFSLYCEIVDAQRPATDVLLEKVNEAIGETMPNGVLFSEGFESVSWVVPPPRIPTSFRAKLADEWGLRPDGKHVRKATWEGMEFVAIEITGRRKGVVSARFQCPGLNWATVEAPPSGWSKKDRRYLSQLWALWSEHHQEVPGSDWREVTKARLGVR